MEFVYIWLALLTLATIINFVRDNTHRTHETGQLIAKTCVAYAEQFGGTGEEKLRHAAAAFKKFDRRKRFSELQVRTLLEEAVNARQ